MSGTSLTSRIVRLQFSLRALMVLMAVLGIAITIFRWPWQATKQESWMQSSLLRSADGPGNDSIVRESNRWQSKWWPPFSGKFSANRVDEYRVTTTYRRGWTGKPQRHGLQEYWRVAEKRVPVLVMQKHYVDDELRRLIHYDDESGKIVHSEGRLNGVPHGKYLHRGFRESEEGVYWMGKRTGIWQSEYNTSYFNDRERISLQSAYRDGLLHGEWSWKRTTDSRNLQTARFEAGRLVELNGMPKRAAIQKLLELCAISEELRTKLQQSSAIVNVSAESTFTIRTCHVQIGGQSTGFAIHTRAQSTYDPRDLVLDVDPLNPHLEYEFPADEPPLESLLEDALAHSQTLMIRSGKLFLVRISATDLDEVQ